MKENKFLLLMFFIAFVIRVVAVFIHSDYLVPVKDALAYDNSAMSILRGSGIIDLKGNPTSGIPPLYPIFLSIIYFIFGHSYIAVRVVQSAMYSLIPIFLYYTGKNIFSKDEARLACIISVIFPSFIIFSYYGGPGFILSENLFIFILTGIVLYVSGIEHLSFFNCMFIGIMNGLLILTKFNGIFLFFITILYLLVASKNYPKKQLFKSLFILVTFIVLTLSPWILRNYRFSQRLTLIHSGEKVSFLSVILRQFPDLEHKWDVNFKDLIVASQKGEEYKYISKKWGIDEKDVDSAILNKISREIPGRYLSVSYLMKNIKILWSPYYNPLKNTSAVKFNFPYVFLVPFILFGIYFSILRKYKKTIFLLGTIIGLNLFILLIGISSERYRLPIEPLIILYAAFGFFSLLKIFSSPRRRIAFFSFTVLFFIINVVAYLNSDSTIKWLSSVIP